MLDHAASLDASDLSAVFTLDHSTSLGQQSTLEHTASPRASDLSTAVTLDHTA